MLRTDEYILTSARSELIKIGGTDHAPMKRIREINAAQPYRSLGPWSLYDFREVRDWRSVEYDLHYAFRSKQARTPLGQKELFRVMPQVAGSRLRRLNPEQIVSKPKIDRMFQDEEFAEFLSCLFSFTGIWNWIDIQGAWTFTLSPTTAGGRYYTINIGRHEVAFATLPALGSKSCYHSIVMDLLIRVFQGSRNGRKDTTESFATMFTRAPCPDRCPSGSRGHSMTRLSFSSLTAFAERSLPTGPKA